MIDPRRGSLVGALYRRLAEPILPFFVVLTLRIHAVEPEWLGAQLADLAGLVGGLAVGVPVYLLSLLLLRIGAPRVPRRGLARPRPIGFLRPAALGVRALLEEFAWRGLLQAWLGGALPGISMLAFAFTARHAWLEALAGRRLRGRLLAEMFIFALIVGGAYAATGRLMVAVGIHWARNLLIQAGVGAELPAHAAPPPGAARQTAPLV